MLAIDGHLFNVQKQKFDAYEVLQIKWKKKEILHFRNSSSWNIKIVEKCKIDIPNTQTHDSPLYLFGSDTSIKSDVLDYYYGPKPSQMWYQILLS
jgi:hypothetical protein